MVAKAEIYSMKPRLQPATRCKRNLGSAILLAAVEDYRSLLEERHESAKQFLFPQTRDWQQHYDWVVSLAEGVNPVWLRDSLNRSKKKWDAQRFARMSGRMRREI